MAASPQQEEGLSQALAYLDLASVTTAELAGFVADEAVALLGVPEAVVWEFHASLRRLFYERQEADPVSVPISDDTVADLMSTGAPRPVEQEGVWEQLLLASFGIAGQRQSEPTAAVSLAVGDELLGLLLFRGESRHVPHCAAAAANFARHAAVTIQNHRNLRRAQRGESQLEALLETASELSANLDLETVLAAIVERARMVIRAPVAYVMLVNEEAGEIVMRVTAGTMSPEFERLRLKMGGGLGGQVAAGHRTLYTSDYLDDERFDHFAEVDAAVRYEGIRSILGAPMSVSGRFVGVLFVADRRVRVFDEADVVVLTSLAHHAGTGIHNAELYDKARTAVADLAKSNEIVNEQNRRLQRADALHTKLSRSILEGQGLSEIITLVAEETGGQVLVFDHHNRRLAAAGESRDAFGARLASQGIERTAGRIGELRDVIGGKAVETVELNPAGADRTVTRLVVPIVARADFLGSVWVDWPAESLAEGRHLVEEGARVIALEMLKERAVAEVHRRLGRELLDDLLAPHATLDDALSRRAAELGVDLARPHRIVRITLASRDRSDEDTRLARAGDVVMAAIRRQRWCAFAATYERSVVALVDSDCADLTDRLDTLLTGGLRDVAGARAAVSLPCETVEEYGAQFTVAGRALQLLGDRSPAVVDLNEAWVLTLLFRGGDESELRRFVNAQLGAILDHEEQHGPGLLDTLDSYLQLEQSPTRTAAALHLHVNSVYYRLNKLKELLGPSLASPQRALDLRIALVAHRLLFRSGTRRS